MDLGRELVAALEAARNAARTILDLEPRVARADAPPHDVSTVADVAAQRAILDVLGARFPEYGCIAEEATPGALRAPAALGRSWFVDPIDGTRGFVSRNGEYTVMIGLCEAGRPVLGVVADPARGLLAYATLGGGAWEVPLFGHCDDPVRLHVDAARLEEATLAVTRDTTIQEAETLRATLGAAAVCRSYSAGRKLLLVARGEASAYVGGSRRFSSWDVCAGVIIVTEAGGSVCDSRGDPVLCAPGRHSIHGLLASNGLLHDVLRRRLGAP